MCGADHLERRRAVHTEGARRVLYRHGRARPRAMRARMATRFRTDPFGYANHALALVRGDGWRGPLLVATPWPDQRETHRGFPRREELQGGWSGRRPVPPGGVEPIGSPPRGVTGRVGRPPLSNDPSSRR